MSFVIKLDKKDNFVTFGRKTSVSKIVNFLKFVYI